MDKETKKFQKERLLRYVSGMKSWKKKTMWVQDLSLLSGIFEDVIQEDLSQFEPLVRLFPDFDVMILLPLIETKLIPQNKKTKIKPKKPLRYETVTDFILSEMTIPGGMVDRNDQLSDKQLKELRKIIAFQLKSQKG